MAKFVVETYYTCSFKTSHYLDDINETELSNLEKRDDGKFEILDVKLDNRKTKSLDTKNKNTNNKRSIEHRLYWHRIYFYIFCNCFNTDNDFFKLYY